jgi:hypothetical protein
MAVHQDGIDRRTAIAGIVAGAAALSAAPALAAAEAPLPRGLHTIMLFKRQPNLTQVEFMRWYEELHAPAFVTVAGPHIARYSRSFVIGWRGHMPPDFDALVEFGYRSEKARDEAARLASSDAAAPLIGAKLQTAGVAPTPVAKRTGPLPGAPGAPKPSGPLRQFGIEETLLLGKRGAPSPTPSWKTTLVLKRATGTTAGQFDSAARDLARSFTGRYGDALQCATLATGIVPEDGMALGADGFLNLWPKPGMVMPPFFETPAGIEIASVVDLQGHESQVGG